MGSFFKDFWSSLLLLTSTWFTLSFTIAPVITLKGGIIPPGAIIKRIGDDINITCWIDPSELYKGHNSSSLWFQDEDKKIPRENISIISETSIVLMIKNAPAMSKRYSCMQDVHGLDYSRVIVGTEPQNVTDFECRSYDYEYFICNFTSPPNPVGATYNLTYTIQTYARSVYTCPLTQKVTGYTCNLTLETSDAVYRQLYEYYTFTLYAENLLGNLTQHFYINNFDSVIPAKPNFIRVNTTTNSVTYEWVNLKWTAYKKKGLDYEVKIMSQYDERNWTVINMEDLIISYNKSKNTFRTHIPNLKYAYAWYDIRVRTKVRTAKNDESMWSETFSEIFQTEPKIPDDPPNTDIGSFHIDLSDNIHLYWEVLPKYKENGRDMRYIITEVRKDGKLTDIKPLDISLTSAKYRLSPADYEFKIRSENSVGFSEKSSTIRIPKQNYPQPQWLRKVYHQQKYTLSWTAPKNPRNLVDYTVFWCVSKTETFDQCEGSIYFKHFSKNTTNITHEEKNSTMNFAVSANYENASSGMVWAMCTALKTSDFGKVKPMVSLGDPTTIKIQWSLECLYSSILEGYHLVYCPVRDLSQNPECKEQEMNVTISKNAKEFIVRDLKPYTTYKFIISMYSSEKQGPPSDPVLITTVETAPTPPRTLQYRNLTSNSVTLIWNPPEFFNGKLRYYEVIYNEGKVKVEAEGLSNVSEIVYTLNSLRSFYDYKVYVIARTTEDSKPSNDIHFKTKIGIPGVVDKVSAVYDNPEVTFTWERPAVPSGRIEFYEFKSVFLKDTIKEREVISRINGTRCKLLLPPCIDSNSHFEFFVRAVNAAEKKEMDYHTFSKRDTSSVNKYSDIESLPIQIEDDLESLVFKRHSHAEVDGDHPLNHNENRIRHNRHERENGRGLQIHNDNRPPIDYTDDSLSLKCAEDKDPKLQKWFEKHLENRKLLLSEWKSMQTFFCAYKNDIKRKIILVFGVVTACVVMLILFYFGWRKYSKMKNIVVVFPPGLTDLDQEIHKTPGSVMQHSIGRSSESLYKNENHRLLASIGNDSGYLHGIDGSDKSEGYDISDPIREDEQSAQSDSVEMSEISDSTNTSPSESPNVNIREKTMPSVTPMIINGYVQQQPFPKNPEPSFNGYTTLDAFGKPIIPASANVEFENKQKELNPNNTGINENICGYVTHKQLSEFGHRLQ